MRQFNFSLLATSFLTLKTVMVFSQSIIPGTFLVDEHQVRELKTDTLKEIIFHPSVKWEHSGSDYFHFFNPIIQTSYNSTYARGFNDGVVWKGKGITQEFHGGFSAQKGIVRVSILPTLFISQNEPFELASINPFKHEFNYQFRQMAGSSANIDFVQRFGNKQFVKLGFGQSEIQINAKPVILGVSTQNFTIGPAIRNHLLMSNGGEGFPFFYITSPKIHMIIKKWDLGYIQPMLFYGLLEESDYFDANAQNDQRYINGLSIGYELPKNLGISIGFSKILYKNTQDFKAYDLISVFRIIDDGVRRDPQGNVIDRSRNDTFDQLASAFIQWKIPDQNMRIYFELGKNDFTGNFRWTVTEFEHNRLYTVGLEKIWPIENGGFHLSYEHTYLPFFKNYVYRNTNSAYTHTEARQGYTHNGQLLGPGIGPGSVSDFLEINWLKKINWGLAVQRIRFDEDYFITQIPNNDEKIDKHDVEYSLTGKILKKGKKTSWGINSTISYRFNQYFTKGNDKLNGYLQFFTIFNLSNLSVRNN